MSNSTVVDFLPTNFVIKINGEVKNTDDIWLMKLQYSQSNDLFPLR